MCLLLTAMAPALTRDLRAHAFRLDLLTGVFAKVEVVKFDGLGHMGQATHPEIVNESIGRFLGAAERKGLRACGLPLPAGLIEMQGASHGEQRKERSG